MKSSTSHPDIQGEDDYVSAEKYKQKYNQKMRAFDDSGKVEEAANDPTSSNAYEDAALRMDEAKVRAHANALRTKWKFDWANPFSTDTFETRLPLGLYWAAGLRCLHWNLLACVQNTVSFAYVHQFRRIARQFQFVVDRVGGDDHEVARIRFMRRRAVD